MCALLCYNITAKWENLSFILFFYVAYVITVHQFHLNKLTKRHLNFDGKFGFLLIKCTGPKGCLRKLKRPLLYYRSGNIFVHFF